ncbi:hypothetical protein R1080702_066 [Cyanophage S-RIM32]|uniref:Uncharacterized protein n=1 Tax=Cyanophage S-RIM32 TaxID=1278479 RepID=A0A127KM50_9CAUD|nr:hypothetical protein BJD26_gp190 [Cyanophage S-RIM32]AMO43075.1 hypothetical protein R1080702_066 [Cyanophage S-RIM32]
MTVTKNSHYYTEVEVDENGDLVLPLPTKLLEDLGWTTDTEVEFEMHDDYFTIRRASK